MATMVELDDTRDPMDVGREVFESLLAGREIVTDREALIHALYDAAQHVGDAWYPLADRMSQAVSSLDNVATGRQVIDQRREVDRSVLTTWESTSRIAKAETEATGPWSEQGRFSRLVAGRRRVGGRSNRVS